MNDLTTAFAVPKSEGNAQPMIFQNILQYRGVRLQNAVVRWLGGRSGNIVPKPAGNLRGIGPRKRIIAKYESYLWNSLYQSVSVFRTRSGDACVILARARH